MRDQLQPLALIETDRRQIANHRGIVGHPAAMPPSAMRSRGRSSLKTGGFEKVPRKLPKS
jgi:hypothetical protein